MQIPASYPKGRKQFRTINGVKTELFALVVKNLYGLPTVGKHWSKERDSFIRTNPAWVAVQMLYEPSSEFSPHSVLRRWSIRGGLRCSRATAKDGGLSGVEVTVVARPRRESGVLPSGVALGGTVASGRAPVGVAGELFFCVACERRNRRDFHRCGSHWNYRISMYTLVGQRRGNKYSRTHRQR